MNRQEKATEVENLKARITQSPLAILSDYSGLSSNDFNELRAKLRKTGSSIKVVKNRLVKIALKGSPQEHLLSKFVGTTAVTTSGHDPVAPAKVLIDFVKSHERIKLKVGSMNGRELSVSAIEALAKLPSREELIAKLLGSMSAPARNWVSVLAQVPRQVVNVLSAIRDQKQNQA
jgi:large subunit ribosomal protein L10